MEFASNSNSSTMATMGVDPFVSPRVLDQPKPKSIEEILNRMNGFVSELDELDAVPRATVINHVLSENSLRPSSPSNESAKPIVVFSVPKVASELTELIGRANKSAIQTVKISVPRKLIERARIQTAHLFSKNEKSDVSSANAPVEALICKPFAAANREVEIPVDIRDFVPVNPPDSNTQVLVPQLEPLQCSFDFEMDYFERHTLLKRIDGCGKKPGEAVFDLIPQSKQSIQSTIQTDESYHEMKTGGRDQALEQASKSSDSLQMQRSEELGEQRPAQKPEVSGASRDVQAEVIWVRENELIHVDGRDGYDYIDLTCFDIAQASFEANRIRINNGVRVFEIDYRNVSHAMFADGKQVELAAYELDFPKPAK